MVALYIPNDISVGLVAMGEFYVSSIYTCIKEYNHMWDINKIKGHK